MIYFMMALTIIFALSNFAFSQEACVPTTTLKTSVTLAWNPPVQPVGVTTTGYILDKRVDSGSWSTLNTYSSVTRSAQDSSLVPGHTYYYRLSDTAVAGDGSTGQSGYANNGVPPPCVAVQVVVPPSNLIATPQ